MDMMATPVAVARTSILRTAQFRGGILGRILVRQPLTDIRLEYVRFYMVRLPYSVEARRFPFRRHATEGVMTVIVNALYGRCAVKDTDLQLAPVQGGTFPAGKVRTERTGSRGVRGGFRKTHRDAYVPQSADLRGSLL